MTNHRELLKAIIEKLTGILGDLESVETCLQCSLPAVARGLCGKHYNQWRREYCREHQIKKLSDQPEVQEPDPRQAQLFSDTPPDIAIDQLLTKLEF